MMINQNNPDSNKSDHPEVNPFEDIDLAIENFARYKPEDPNLANKYQHFKQYDHGLSEDVQSSKQVEQYCYDVLVGRITNGELIKLACERHLNDLARQKTSDFPYRFSHKKADNAIKFFSLLTHVGTSDVFVLMPWQQFIVGSIFGWIYDEKDIRTGKYLRRFREATIFVGRKNGKSTLLSGIILLMLLWDNEPNPSAFTAAASGKQARLVFDDAKAMFNKDLKEAFEPEITRDKIFIPMTNGTVETVNSKADNLDGRKPSLVVIDELHAFKSDSVYNVLRTSFGARAQPLFFIISTAGFNLGCIGEELFNTSKDIMYGIRKAENTFCVLYTIDDGDDFREPDVWLKANPALGKYRLVNELGTMVKDALYRPTQLGNLFTKYLNKFMSGSDQWLKYQAVVKSRSKFKLKDFKNTSIPCYIGLDIGDVSDLSAISYLFHDFEGLKGPKDHYYLFTTALFPEESMPNNTPQTQEMFCHFSNEKNGSFEITPGETCDYDRIEELIVEACASFNVVSIEVDQYQAKQLHKKLVDKKLPSVLRNQSRATLNEPSRFFETLILQNRIHTDGSKVLEWCMLNAHIHESTNGLILVQKESKHSGNKIDCLKAAISALAGSMDVEVKKVSAIERSGVRIIKRS